MRGQRDGQRKDVWRGDGVLKSDRRSVEKKSKEVKYTYCYQLFIHSSTYSVGYSFSYYLLHIYHVLYREAIARNRIRLFS